MAMSDMHMDRIAYMQWIISESHDNSAELNRLKEVVATCLKEYVSEKQKQYIMLYFFDSLTISEIADMYEIHKSTVSRTIKRGLKRIFDHMRFAVPQRLQTSDFSMQTRLKKG